MLTGCFAYCLSLKRFLKKLRTQDSTQVPVQGAGQISQVVVNLVVRSFLRRLGRATYRRVSGQQIAGEEQGKVVSVRTLAACLLPLRNQRWRVRRATQEDDEASMYFNGRCWSRFNSLAVASCPVGEVAVRSENCKPRRSRYTISWFDQPNVRTDRDQGDNVRQKLQQRALPKSVTQRREHDEPDSSCSWLLKTCSRNLTSSLWTCEVEPQTVLPLGWSAGYSDRQVRTSHVLEPQQREVEPRSGHANDLTQCWRKQLVAQNCLERMWSGCKASEVGKQSRPSRRQG